MEDAVKAELSSPAEVSSALASHSIEDIQPLQINGVKSEQAETVTAPPLPSLPSPPLPQASLPLSTDVKMDDSDLDDLDDDMDLEEPMTQEDNTTYSSDESIRPKKRKTTVHSDDEDYIRNNPDLYGLRRSGRARHATNLAESSGDDLDDDSVAGEEDDSADESDDPRPRKRLRRTSQPVSKQHTPAIQSSDISGDDDEYGGKHKRLSKKQKRRFLEGDTLGPAHAEIRFSSRRAARTNYNEDDEDPFAEDESEMLTPNYWAGETTENPAPAIDIVLDHRPKANITDPGPLTSKDQFEYFIKWQGQAYYHATWNSLDDLAGVRSLRRLDNYIKKVLSEDIRVQTDPTITPEEKEKWSLDREQHVEYLEDLKHVDRVIGQRVDRDGSTEYFVKWKTLFYDQCTWETSELVSSIGQAKIDQFLDRQQQSFRSNQTELNPATRSKFQRINEQPDYIKHGSLRDFQITGLNFLAFNWARNMNVVLADEMGLGKTVQTVAFINWLRHDRGQEGPFLVVVPLSTMPAWQDTFDYWTPDIHYVVYNGNNHARQIIKDYELLPDGNVKHPRFHVLLTTYEYVLHDAAFLSQIKWQFLAVDEAHRLKNRESQLYDRLREFKAPARLLITGTPVQNNLGELSALFDFINPGVVNIDEHMDLTEEEASSKIAQLTEDIKPFMLRRTKNKVEKDLPPKTEKILRVELSDVQLEYYKNILTKNYAALNQGSKGPKQSLLNIMMELKKATNHPWLFPGCEDRLVPAGARKEEILRALITSSGKMMLLDQLLTKLKQDGHRCLIFSQMVKMLDLLGDYMDYRGHAYQRLDGTIAAGPRRVAIDHFNAPDSQDFCFLLSTRAGGLGINLMTADTVIIFDSDWNPQADLQAMARAHRIGQTRPVSVYRLVSKETIEEEILERARNKLMLEFLTIQRGVTGDKATQARMDALVGEPGSSNEISRILKKRGQKMFEQTDNQKKLEELDLDAVLNNAEDYKVEQPDDTEADGGEEFLKSFDFVDVKVDEMSWDDIIPKEELEAIKAEEERRNHDRYLAEVIEQNKPRSRGANHTSDEREARQARRIQQREDADSDSESDAGPNADPARPLNSREYRYLLRGHLKFGALEDRPEEFLGEARLRNRDINVVKAAMTEVLDRASQLWEEEQQRMRDLERGGKQITKKDKKAVLFEHKGVKRINAETLLERPSEMRLLKEVCSIPDIQSFRVPEATKAAGYSCPWGAREDGMLCVGIHRHGYGSWERIRDDPDLGLTEKFFLEEHRVDKKAEREATEGSVAKSPGAVHLVRRADYLLSVLKAMHGNDANAKRAVENHHRNNKKNKDAEAKAAMMSSPAPSSHKKPEKQRHRTISSHRDSVERVGTPRLDSRHRLDSEARDRERHRERERDRERDREDRRSRPDRDHGHHKRTDSHTNGGAPHPEDGMMKLLFKPVRDNLKEMQKATKANIPDSSARAHELRGHLKKIGAFIAESMRDAEETSTEGLEKKFWDYAVTYWPNKGIRGQELARIFRKILASEQELAGDASPQEDAETNRPNGNYHTSPPR